MAKSSFYSGSIPNEDISSAKASADAAAASASAAATSATAAAASAAQAHADLLTLEADIGTSVQAHDADLDALAANSTNGLWAHTGPGTGAARTITGTANEVSVTNGDGAVGNPTVSLPAALTFTGKSVTGGLFGSITKLAVGKAVGTYLVEVDNSAGGTGEAFIRQKNANSDWVVGPSTALGTLGKGWGLFSVTGGQYRISIDDNGVVSTGHGALTGAVQKLTNSTGTASLIPNGTVSLTYPATSTTLVGTDATQTLTSKVIDASNNTVSNLTTAMFAANVVDTDGTLTANSDTRLASQKATKTYADTKIASSIVTTRGDIITRGVSGPQRVGLGANGTVVSSDGTDTVFRTLTALLDVVFGSTRGMTLVRGASSWSALAVGANLYALKSNGTDPAWAPSREVLSAARTYYVRSDGSDSNNGLTNAAGGAFLTVQKAVDTVCALDMSIYQVTIQIVDGTYTGAITLKPYQGSLAPIIQGNNATPANVLISVAGNAIVCSGGYWKIRDFKLTASSGGAGLTISGAQSNVEYQNLDFGTTATWHVNPTLGGTVTATGNYAVSGSATGHIIANLNGVADLRSRTITYSNSPAFSFANFTATTLGVIVCNGMTFTNGGTVTGTRYSISGNSDINTSGSGATYIPGSVAGTTTTGGQYE
jgi:hypothetical protein